MERWGQVVEGEAVHKFQFAVGRQLINRCPIARSALTSPATTDITQ